MKKTKRTISLLLSAVMLLTVALSGCGAQKSPSAGETTVASATPSDTGPVELSIIAAQSNRKFSETDRAIVEIEKKTNTKLSVTLVADSDYVNKYNVLAASANIPDISVLSGFNFQYYADQGLFMDITSLVDGYGTNMKKYIAQSTWDYVKYKGKNYVVPAENIPGKYVTIFREDWLKNLGLQVPKTLEEYKNVLEKFTFGDPDKNGKNDTFGMGANGNWVTSSFNCDFDPIFGAFGFGVDQYYLQTDKVNSTMISDGYRSAISYIKGLWDAKVIDPEMFTIKSDQAIQKLLQSKSGSVTSWWSTGSVLMQNYKMPEINPNAQWVPVTTAITGADGQGGLRSNGIVFLTSSISSKCKNAEAAVKFIDYLYSDEGWLLANHGFEGVDYSQFGSDNSNPTLGYALASNFNRLDLYKKWVDAATTPDKQYQAKLISAGANIQLYTDLMYGIPATDEKNSMDANLKAYEIESFIKFVTGGAPLTDDTWNEYVNTWKNEKGGLKILESMVKQYNSVKGTQYTAAN